MVVVVVEGVEDAKNVWPAGAVSLEKSIGNLIGNFATDRPPSRHHRSPVARLQSRAAEAASCRTSFMVSDIASMFPKYAHELIFLWFNL